MTIGVLSPYLGGFYFGDLMTDLHRQARAAGMSLLSIRAGHRSPISLPIAHELVDAWIIILDCLTGAQLDQIIASGKPVVSIAHDFGRAEVASVQSDNRTAIAAAVDFLVREGHRDIACVGVFSQSDQILRLAEFRRSLTRHGIALRPDCEVGADQFGYAGGRTAARTLMATGKAFTAVMCFTDLIASGMMDFLTEHGVRVPQDVAVIGYDNEPLTLISSPPLATIDQDIAAQARLAVTLVREQLEGGVRRGGALLVENRFLPRASCGAPAQAQARMSAFDQARHATEISIGYELTKDLIGADFVKVLERMWVLAPYLEWACIGQWSDFAQHTDRLRVHDVLDLKNAHTQYLIGTELPITRFPPLRALPDGAGSRGRFTTVVPILFAHKWTVLAVTGIHRSDEDVARYPTLMHYIDLLSLAMERSVLDEETRARVARQESVECEILRVNHELEERVRRRTESLEQSNARLTETNAKLSRAHTQLVQAEKLASIGQLAAGVAHEINNPIGYISSNFGTLQHYVEDMFAVIDAYRAAEPLIAEPAAARRLQALRGTLELDLLKEDIPTLMGECKEGITRVRKIVDDLKNFSRADEHDVWQWTDLNQGIDSTLNIIHSEIKFKADVVKQYGTLPKVRCMPSQINQVVMNLIVNAVHAFDNRRGRIVISTGAAEGEVWIDVADDGCGISETNLTRIFDPFFTTRPVGKGTGLGLSISYGIIQRHGGQITVASEPDRGTSMRIVLPLEAAPSG